MIAPLSLSGQDQVLSPTQLSRDLYTRRFHPLTTSLPPPTALNSLPATHPSTRRPPPTAPPPCLTHPQAFLGHVLEVEYTPLRNLGIATPVMQEFVDMMACHIPVAPAVPEHAGEAALAMTGVSPPQRALGRWGICTISPHLPTPSPHHPPPWDTGQHDQDVMFRSSSLGVLYRDELVKAVSLLHPMQV